MHFHKLFAFLMAVMMACTMVIPASAATASDALTDTAQWLQKNVPSPTVSSIGGEWAVLGLARSGLEVPQKWYDAYYSNLVDYVKSCKGVLHNRKYTEYSRVAITLAAIGKDPTNVAGYDLMKPLTDFDKTVWQGVNGAIFALIAMDCVGYQNTVRQDYIDHILAEEISGGGWALSGDEADPDMTAMALQALAKYQDQAKVKAATNRGLAWLSKVQNADGSYSTYGVSNCESVAQVIVALCELGIDPTDKRFVKNGNTLEKTLLSFYTKGKGFCHTKGGSTDGMSTEQAFYALVSLSRYEKGLSGLYDMGPAFPDIVGHKHEKAIQALVEQGIINGMGDGTFAPNATMTRAQFCTIVVKALGLTPAYRSVFSDVKSSDWYGGYVSTANLKGIVNGVGNGKFDPDGTIIGQHAALMVNRAAKVLGLNYNVVNNSAQPILRGEVAQMIYDLLEAAK